MSEENLNEAINQNIQTQQRGVAIATLSDRLHLTVGKVAQLVADPDHGATISTITLQELVDAALAKMAPVEDAEVEAADDEDEDDGGEIEAAEDDAPRAKRKVTKKKASKKATAKKTAKASTRSDAGSKKPRLNRDLGYKEVLAALKAAKDFVPMSDIVDATGLPLIQVRTFLKELQEQGKVESVGKARATKYGVA